MRLLTLFLCFATYGFCQAPLELKHTTKGTPVVQHNYVFSAADSPYTYKATLFTPKSGVTEAKVKDSFLNLLREEAARQQLVYFGSNDKLLPWPAYRYTTARDGKFFAHIITILPLQGNFTLVLEAETPANALNPNTNWGAFEQALRSNFNSLMDRIESAQ